MACRRIQVVFAAAALFALSVPAGARADAGAAKPVEEVDFAISCGSAVQPAFRHAVWTLHSFWYPEALKEFTAVAEAEPGCAMAYWGIAMSHWYPLWYPPPPAGAEGGLGGGGDGDGGADQDRARAGLHRRDRGLLPRQRQARPPHPRRRLREGDGAGLSELSGGPRGRGVLCAGARHDRAADRQDLCQSKEGGADPQQGLEGRAEPSRRRALPDPQRRFGAICRRRGWTRRSATPRSRPTCRMRCTCPRTSSPGSACGSNRSTRTAPQKKRRSPMSKIPSGRAATTATPSMPWIISNTPICRPRRTARPKRWSTS